MLFWPEVRRLSSFMGDSVWSAGLWLLPGRAAPGPSGVPAARVGARLLALAAGIWHNWRINALRERSLIAYDH
jgi:hypothetical protein